MALLIFLADQYRICWKCGFPSQVRGQESGTEPHTIIPFYFPFFSGVIDNTGSNRDNMSIGGCWIFKWFLTNMFCVSRAEIWYWEQKADDAPFLQLEACRVISLHGKSSLVNLTSMSFQKGNRGWLRQLSKSGSRWFWCPGVLLASHSFPGLLRPPGFQNRIVCIPRVLLWEERDVECTQQLWGPETRKENTNHP